METEVYWRAVEARDARFDGAFVFGVKTTGIFCRPSCAARKPKRENVEFYPGVEGAELDGFRACLRCKPKAENIVDPQIGMVLRACEMIEQDEQFSLETLSGELGLSPSHLQRTFKEIVGISPKKYGEIKRLERFKNEIRDGSDVVTAMYEAGYGSSSRLYEKAAESLGMTPAIYKKGGKGMNINYIITDCDLGKLLVGRTPRGICSVTFGDSDAELLEGLEKEFPNAEILKDDHDLKTATDAILKYLAGKNKRLVLPLDLQATAFQMQVWDFLRKIPYGETRSYSEVAAEMGDKKKVRAVAQACAKNRVALVIPCHRVIASDGKLSGYRWGVERKKRLLENEIITRSYGLGEK
ncbi:MAG: bifunctional DNA-binding transcriptional regulator/O6-methylguanine-DNA methyltransferase Ada [Pyrinomonadaceae bacterium]